MTTTGVGSNSNTATSGSPTSSSNYNLTPSDFINMMITQLQNQDPTDPVKSSDLLAQMSQIGQLQSSTQLTSTLQGLTLQNQIGAGSSLIGKTVSGLDENKDPISGVVKSVKVAGNNVNLELDNGGELGLSSVTQISPAVAATAAAAN